MKSYKIRNSFKYGAASDRISDFGYGNAEQDEIKRNSVKSLKGMIPNKLGGAIKLQGTQLFTELVTPAGTVYDVTKMFEIVLDNIKLRVMFDTDNILLLIPGNNGAINYLEVPFGDDVEGNAFIVDLSTLYYVISDSKNTIVFLSTSGAFKMMKDTALLDSGISPANFTTSLLTDTDNLIYKNINVYRLDTADTNSSFVTPIDQYVGKINYYGINWLIPVVSDIFVGDTVSIILMGVSYDFIVVKQVSGIQGLGPSGGTYVYINSDPNSYNIAVKSSSNLSNYAIPILNLPGNSFLTSESAINLYVLKPIDESVRYGSYNAGASLGGTYTIKSVRSITMDQVFDLAGSPVRSPVFQWPHKQGPSPGSLIVQTLLKETVIQGRYLPINETVRNTSFNSIAVLSNRAFATIGNRIFASMIGDITMFAPASTTDVTTINVLATDAFNFSITGETTILSIINFNDKGILIVCPRTMFIIPRNNTQADTVQVVPFVTCPNGVSYIPPVPASIDGISGVLYTNNDRTEVWFLVDLGINNAPRNEEISFYTPYFTDDKIRKMVAQPTRYGTIVWVLTDSGLLYGLNIGRGKYGWFEFGRDYNILDICVGSDPDPENNFFELNIIYEIEGVTAVALFSDAYSGNLIDVQNSDVPEILDSDIYSIYRSSVNYDNSAALQDFLYLKQKDNRYFNIGDTIYLKSLNTNASFSAIVGSPVQATLVHSYETQAKYIIPVCNPALTNFKKCRLESITVFPLTITGNQSIANFEYFLQYNQITQTTYGIFPIAGEDGTSSVGGTSFLESAYIDAYVYELGASLVEDIQGENYIRPNGVVAHVELFPDEILNSQRNTKDRYKIIEELILDLFESWNFYLYYLTDITFGSSVYSHSHLVRKFNEMRNLSDYKLYSNEVRATGSSSEKNIRVKIESRRHGRLELKSITYTSNIQQ